MVFGLSVEDARAQLISPGELIEGHAAWDNIETCISCHTLGTRGIDDTRCLSCHIPLQERIEDNLGLHATYEEPTCATCHKDHFGRDFDSIRFDTLSFDHGLTDYDLIQSHESVSCLSCHEPEFQTSLSLATFQETHGTSAQSYQGLESTCSSCHTPDNVHGLQFERESCDSCHDAAVWTEAPVFDHDLSDYPLTGEHIDLECNTCHEPSLAEPEIVVYTPVDFLECSSCHEDEHQGSFGPTCASCHSTADWSQMVDSDFEDSFDHAVTGYELIGLHESATCISCHEPSLDTRWISMTFDRSTLGDSYPIPESTSCESCHEDIHENSIVESATCISCHSEFGWVPSDFDVFRHQDESDYPLDGAHLAVLCSQCHEPEPSADAYSRLSFLVQDQTCEGCHLEDDPHERQFELDTCESCHATQSWESAENTFDHATTSFELIGAHEIVACVSCHEERDPLPIHYRGLDASCASCHSDENPHQSQFEGQTCESCHDQSSFFMTSFDHDLTEWPLVGAHENVACVSCHPSATSESGDPYVLYEGVGTACADCHGSEVQNEQ